MTTLPTQPATAGFFVEGSEQMVSRQQAMAAGASRYFTGLPCSKGHVSEMHVKEGCVQCKRVRSANHRAMDIDSAKRRDAAYRASNLEQVRAKDRAHYNDHIPRMRGKSAQWRKSNPGRQKELTTAWRAVNAAYVREYAQKWFASHPEAQRIYAQNRRTREMQGEGRISKDIVERLFVLQRGLCACCKKKLGSNFHLDHIVPLARGGEHSDSNVQLLTQRCNNQKHARDPIEFMQSRGFLL